MIYDVQKADLWKRISAGIFDLIMTGIIVVLIGMGVAGIVNYDGYMGELSDCYEKYEKEYGIDIDIIGTEEFDKLSDAQKDKYKEADEKFSKDEQVIYLREMLLNLSLVIIVVSVVLGFLIWEFILPLVFKNGQTLGKKIFGLAVIRYDCVRVSPVLMFARSMLGKCTVELLVPLLAFALFMLQIGGIFSLIVFAGILITQAVFFIMTRERTLIHDVMAQTVVVDLSSQMIFDTPEALLEYKQKLQAEKAAKAEY